MIDAKQPLIYFANNSDFEAQYDNTAANDYRDKQAVFVGDTHMIYTHGVAFNGNDTIYNDSELRGLISNAEYDDTEIKGQISTLEGLVSGVQSDLEGLHDWSQEDIDARIQALISDAEWMRDNFPNEIISQSNFGEDDVEEYLQRIGVITIDEETGQPVVTWSTFQQSYNSLESRVDQLEQNGPDIEGLETRLHQYINEDTAIADLTSKWFWSHDDDIEWALAGLKTAANNAESFASVWSAMDQKVNGLDDTVHGTAGLVTKVSNIENNFVAKTELATLVENAGFATTAGTVAKSDLDGSVAALFSQTSSTNSAVDSKLAGVITSSNLDSAISTMLASNGTGAAAVSTYVNNWWSGVTISADDIYLDGKTWAEYINAIGITANSLSAEGDLYVGKYNKLGTYTINIGSGSINIYGEASTDENGEPEVHTSTIQMNPFNGITVEGNEYFDVIQVTENGFFINKNETTNTGYYFTKDELKTPSVKTGQITSEVEDTPIEVDAALSFSGNTVVSDTGIVTPALNVSNGISVSDGSAKITGDEAKLPTTTFNGVVTANNSVTVNNNSLKVTDRPASSAPLYTVDITGTEIDMYNSNSSTNTIRIQSDGNIRVTDKMYATSFEQTSDRNLKDIVSDTTLTVEQVANAPAVNFTWKKDAEDENKKQNVGTIAQYWQVVLPEVVGEEEDGTLTMQYSNAAMISAITTAKEVVALKQEIAELKSQIAELIANK